MVGAVFFLSACDIGTACTLEFRTISIELIGDTPDDFYTLRSSTGDTIRLSNETFEDYYPVLDDSWQEELRGSEEEFVFEAVLDGTVVVSETFVVEADVCHINKVSGPESATID